MVFAARHKAISVHAQYFPVFKHFLDFKHMCVVPTDGYNPKTPVRNRRQVFFYRLMFRIQHQHVDRGLKPFEHMSRHLKIPDMCADEQASGSIGHHIAEVVLPIEVKCEFCTKPPQCGCFVEDNLSEYKVISVNGKEGTENTVFQPLPVQLIDVPERGRGKTKKIQCNKEQDKVRRIHSTVTKKGYENFIAQNITA
jgi:hypothetical protein